MFILNFKPLNFEVEKKFRLSPFWETSPREILFGYRHLTCVNFFVYSN